jgi:hypothetical protein
LAKNKFGAVGWIPEFASIGPSLGLGGGEGYSKSGSMRAFCLSTTFDGGQSLYSRRSIGDEPLVINQYAMPIASTTQPDTFSDVLRHPIRDGFADRLLVAYPNTLNEFVNDAELSYPEVESQMTNAFRKLRAKVQTLGTGPRNLITVPFNAEAAQMWAEYAKFMRARARSLNDQVAGARIKATAFVARIATLHAFINHALLDEPLVVNATHMLLAKQMMRALLDHRAVSEAIAFEPVDERRARALAQAIVSREAFSFSPVEVRRSWKIPNCRTENELRSALLELQNCGWLRHGFVIGRTTRDALPTLIEIDPQVLTAAQKLMKGN